MRTGQRNREHDGSVHRVRQGRLQSRSAHNTGEALTLRSTGYVYLLHLSECGHGNSPRQGLVLGGILDANLAQIASRLDALLGEMAGHGLVDLLGLDGAEAELNGLVTIGGSGLNLAYLVGLSLDNRNRRSLASSLKSWVMPILVP